MSGIDSDPERIAREREEMMRRMGQRDIGDEPLPWDSGEDMQERSRQAANFEREDRLRAVREAKSSGSGWVSRADQDLIPMGSDGNPVSTSRRPVDMSTADEYGQESQKAIEIINKFFASQSCSEIHLNSPNELFAKYQGERVRIMDGDRPAQFRSEEEYNLFIQDLVRRADTNYTWEDIKRQARGVIRLAGGDRMMIMTPPVTPTVHVAIHKVVARQWTLESLIENGTMNSNMANILIASVKAHANILVCGEMGAGKSTLLSLLAQYIPESERVALIEEVPEIFINNLPDLTPMTYYPQSSGGTSMELPEVLDTALYGRFDRILIGEIHDQGMYRMLRVMSTGGDGSMSTFHAGDAKSALDQVRNHVLLEYPQLPSHTVAHFIRSAINLVVVVERNDGQHRIKEMAEVEWRNLSETHVNVGVNMLYHWDPRGERTLDGKPGFVSSGRPDENGKLLEKVRRYGVPMERQWFPADNLMSR